MRRVLVLVVTLLGTAHAAAGDASSGSTPGGFNAKTHQPPLALASAPGAPLARTPMTGAQLGRDWRVYVFTFVIEAFFFAGLTMKTLMSELF